MSETTVGIWQKGSIVGVANDNGGMSLEPNVRRILIHGKSESAKNAIMNLPVGEKCDYSYLFQPAHSSFASAITSSDCVRQFDASVAYAPQRFAVNDIVEAMVLNNGDPGDYARCRVHALDYQEDESYFLPDSPAAYKLQVVADHPASGTKAGNFIYCSYDEKVMIRKPRDLCTADEIVDMEDYQEDIDNNCVEGKRGDVKAVCKECKQKQLGLCSFVHNLSHPCCANPAVGHQITILELGGESSEHVNVQAMKGGGHQFDLDRKEGWAMMDCVTVKERLGMMFKASRRAAMRFDMPTSIAGFEKLLHKERQKGYQGLFDSENENEVDDAADDEDAHQGGEPLPGDKVFWRRRAPPMHLYNAMVRYEKATIEELKARGVPHASWIPSGEM
jgi:hypothetical protein